MRFYVAARFGNGANAIYWADVIRKAGHVVENDWHRRFAGGSSTHLPDLAAAQIDLNDIDASDVFLHLTSDPSAGYTTGGSHVEFGYAYAQGLQMAILGPKESVFHSLPGVQQFQTIGDLVAWLDTLPV
jgi:hypothetical protein